MHDGGLSTDSSSISRSETHRRRPKGKIQRRTIGSDLVEFANNLQTAIVSGLR
jgi:hypothetical protein